MNTIRRSARSLPPRASRAGTTVLRRAPALVLLASLTLPALAQSTRNADTPGGLLLRTNTGLIVGAPFLHQTVLPFESDHYGPYGTDLVTYLYRDGLPVSIRYAVSDTGVLYLDADISYRPDGQVESIVYTSYDDDGLTVSYVDRLTFSGYTPHGPTRASLVTDDGGVGELRIEYDALGRLVVLEEDDAFGDGLFRRETYVWSQPDPGTLPLAAEHFYALDDEVERFRYLYGADGRLQQRSGVNILTSAPDDVTSIDAYYYYADQTLDELFGPVPRSAADAQTAMR